MICSIHQPNFIPWYPFFQKIQEADVFVILVNCQFEKNNYQNRFNFKDKWYTMSVNKGLESIKDKRYLNPQNDWKSIKNKLSEYNDYFCNFDDLISENMADMNSKIIEKISKLLNIKTKIVYDYKTELKGTDRLIDLCIKNNCDTYLSGISGKNYLEVEKFIKNDIKLIYQDELKMDKRHVFEILK